MKQDRNAHRKRKKEVNMKSRREGKCMKRKKGRERREVTGQGYRNQEKREKRDTS